MSMVVWIFNLNKLREIGGYITNLKYSVYEYDKILNLIVRMLMNK